MKGTNDACSRINKCILNEWLFGVKLIKGDNSERYKIVHNSHKLRGLVFQKPQNTF